MKKKNNQLCRRQATAFCFYIALLIVNHSAAAQFCEYEKTIALGKNSLDNRIKYSNDKDLLYYYTKEDCDISKRNLKLFSLNFNTQIKDSIIIRIPESVIIYDMPDICINDDYLVMTDEEMFDVHLFHKEGKNYKYKKKINLPEKSNGGQVFALPNDQFLLTSIYNYHPDQNMYNTNLGIYDAKNDRLINFIHPPLNCIGFSHLTLNNIAVSKDRIAVSDLCGYKIILFDLNLRPVDSIMFNPETGWNNLPDNKFPFDTDLSKIHPKLLIEQLTGLKDSISRIEKIFFVNDKTLLVSSSGNHLSVNKRRIDYWNLGNINKPFASVEKTRIVLLDNDTVQFKKMPFQFNEHPLTYFKDNIMYQLSDDDFPLKNDQPFHDFITQKNLYYENHDPHYSLATFKVLLP